MSQLLDLNRINTLKDIFSGDDSMNDLIETFINQSRKLKGEIGKALDQNDYQELRALIHNLKSSSLNLGAAALSEACQNTEQALKENRTEGLETSINDIYSLIERTEEELNRLFS